MSLLGAGFGFGLYVGWFIKGVHWPLYAAGALGLVALAVIALGRSVMPKKPRLATELLNAAFASGLLIACLVGFGLIWAGVAIADSVAALPKSQGDTLAAAGVAIVTGIAEFIVLAMLRDRASWMWPRGQVQAAYRKAFLKRWPPDTAVFEAIWNDDVLVGQEVRGWGLGARRKRARIIETALRQGGSAGA